MTTAEGKVKAKVTAILKELGAYYFSPVTGGFGRSGVPDIIVCYKGRFIGIECKANGNKPTKLQEMNIQAIRAAGGHAHVINENNVDAVRTLLELM